MLLICPISDSFCGLICIYVSMYILCTVSFDTYVLLYFRKILKQLYAPLGNDASTVVAIPSESGGASKVRREQEAACRLVYEYLIASYYCYVVARK